MLFASLRSLFLTKTLNSAFQNTFQLSFCLSVSKFKAGKKACSFYPSSRQQRQVGSWDGGSLVYRVSSMPGLPPILSSSKPLWDTAGKENTFVVSDLSSLMLTTYVAVVFPSDSFCDGSLTVVNCSDWHLCLCFAKSHAHQQNKGGITVLILPLRGMLTGLN